MMTLGELEKRLLHHLWNRFYGRPFTVRDLTTDYNLRHRKTYAYNTILTVVTHLFEKGMLRRRSEKKSFRYELLFSKTEFVERVSKEFLHELQTDFGKLAIAYFLKPLEDIDPELLQRVAAESKRSS